MSEIEAYKRAKTVQEACQLMKEPSTRVIAGGTDILLKARMFSVPVTLVDISGIDGLSGVWTAQDGIRIGAATRLADVVRSGPLQGEAYQALLQGAVQVGSPQIRNLATLGGNLCNASPSADTAAPLLALEAWAELESPAGIRRVPLAAFFRGPGKTVLAVGELLTAIIIPTQPAGARSVYLKHSPRRAMDLAFVGVAVWTAGQAVRIALGAVAPTPMRATSAENYLNQAEVLDEAVLCEAARLTAQAAKPISDVRSTAAYRLEMVRALSLRALRQILAIQAER
ncbi:MAG TPA: FAD binding domain-containing protein [Anaerolineaceae bacterium]|jgi:carbon-monoxide dehydrogenase medium subunit